MRIVLVRVRIAAPEFEQGVHNCIIPKMKADIRIIIKYKETIILS